MNVVRVILAVQLLTGKIRQFSNNGVRVHSRQGLMFKYLIVEYSANQASDYA